MRKIFCWMKILFSAAVLTAGTGLLNVRAETEIETKMKTEMEAETEVKIETKTETEVKTEIETEIETEGLSDQFYIMEIHEGDEIFERINGRSYQENEDISLDELRYLKIRHYDFDHEIQEGELIVNEMIAQDCLDIFRRLFEAEYEIASVRLIDEYWTGDGDTTDTASIEENNTSAFCYRKVTGGQTLSNHALGLAIDINPRQNPYFSYSTGEPIWYHEGDENYLDRDPEMEHVITEEDLCYQLFTEYGFAWGGNWNNPKDYQHFEWTGQQR